MNLKQHFAIKNGINNKGFSLLEVVVALGIFSIGILAIAGLQITATSGNGKARFATEAATLAQDVAERLLVLDYDHDTPSDHFQLGPTVVLPDPGGLPDPFGGRYRVRYDVAAPGLMRARDITVRVFWNAYGIPRSYNLNFIKTDEF
jgi:prepilin-type N-terminal cleavage/methylation domain-containing protein